MPLNNSRTPVPVIEPEKSPLSALVKARLLFPRATRPLPDKEEIEAP